MITSIFYYFTYKKIQDFCIVYPVSSYSYLEITVIVCILPLSYLELWWWYVEKLKIKQDEDFPGNCQGRSRSSCYPNAFLGKGVLKIWSKFTGEKLCRSAISIKLQSNFIEIKLRYGYSSVNFLYIFRTPFPKNISGVLLL